VAQLSCGLPVRQRTGVLRLVLTAVVLGAVAGIAIGGCSGPGPRAVSSARDERWQRDIAYLARELPAVRAAGLGGVPAPAWNAAAVRLEAAVPGLTDGQVVVKLAQMVAMLHDDETSVEFPPGPVFQFDAQQFGGGLYLLAVPSADRALLGGRLLAMDGQPIAQVMARAGTTIGAEDSQLQGNSETGALDDAALLHWLGITASAASAVLTVRTPAGTEETARVSAAGSGFVTWPYFFVDQQPGLAHVPLALYEQQAVQPYWMRVLAAQHAVYLKYNRCLPGTGFQRLAARALALLRTHPGYRLVVDLRDNDGGGTAPFGSLISGIRADSRLGAPGRVIGLVNQFTNSSATLDAQALKQAGAVLIGQAPADPIDAWGDEQAFQLPGSGIVVRYTSAVINQSRMLLGMPDIVIEPTLAQTLAGDDPVLAAALSYAPGTTR
jgi:hypothetical protein